MFLFFSQYIKKKHSSEALFKLKKFSNKTFQNKPLHLKIFCSDFFWEKIKGDVRMYLLTFFAKIFHSQLSRKYKKICHLFDYEDGKKLRRRYHWQENRTC